MSSGLKSTWNEDNIQLRFRIMPKFRNWIRKLISRPKSTRPKRKRSKPRKKITMRFWEYPKMPKTMKSKKHTRKWHSSTILTETETSPKSSRMKPPECSGTSTKLKTSSLTQKRENSTIQGLCMPNTI